MEVESAKVQEAVKTPEKWDEARANVLAQKISELSLKIEGTILESKINQLYKELETKGLSFRPSCYFSDSWGCPDGIPTIGIPFYLADQKLAKIEEEYAEFLEKEEELILYLRHECGHAFNYAYELYNRDDWHQVFGPYSRPYVDDYKPNPLSKKFVKHFEGWYAQKHPDEDFAETFAVWITPGLDWQKKYEGWDALKKLQYVDNIAKEIGQQPPKFMGDLKQDVPVSELKMTILEYYERAFSKEYPKSISQLGQMLDGDLREIFEAKKEPDYKPAQEFIHKHRMSLRSLVYYWTGTSHNLIRQLIRFLADRATAIDVHYNPAREQHYLMQLEAFLLTLAMNYRYTDRFVEI